MDTKEAISKFIEYQYESIKLLKELIKISGRQCKDKTSMLRLLTDFYIHYSHTKDIFDVIKLKCQNDDCWSENNEEIYDKLSELGVWFRQGIVKIKRG